MYLKINQKKITSADLALIVKALKAGKVIVYPTDTIYGLGCRASDVKAIKKIKKIKHRDLNKPLVIIVSSLNMAKKYCFISHKQELVLKKIWQAKRPTSVILRHRNLLPDELAPKQSTLAVRLPKNDFLRKIVKMVGVPLVSTSFNISGQPVWNEVNFLADQQPGRSGLDLVVDGGKLDNQASRIVDLTGKTIKVIRQ